MVKNEQRDVNDIDMLGLIYGWKIFLGLRSRGSRSKFFWARLIIEPLLKNYTLPDKKDHQNKGTSHPVFPRQVIFFY